MTSRLRWTSLLRVKGGINTFNQAVHPLPFTHIFYNSMTSGTRIMSIVHERPSFTLVSACSVPQDGAKGMALSLSASLIGIVIKDNMAMRLLGWPVRRVTVWSSESPRNSSYRLIRHPAFRSTIHLHSPATKLDDEVDPKHDWHLPIAVRSHIAIYLRWILPFFLLASPQCLSVPSFASAHSGFTKHLISREDHEPLVCMLTTSLF